ncbi:hypothetical protein V6N12_016208 [Hibiscus sabdariffa]|uniref:Secreted protein n=1 Tax=Hibiscus sabdariffa TaxID=183260 RepID=A0ABR2C911_9ROSI
MGGVRPPYGGSWWRLVTVGWATWIAWRAEIARVGCLESRWSQLGAWEAKGWCVYVKKAKAVGASVSGTAHEKDSS